jgi:signal transduction histidine kinase
MKSTRFRRAAVVLIDTLLLGLCLAHLPYVLERPDVPIVVASDRGKVIVEKIRSPDKSGDLAPGDLLLRWNDQPITIPGVVEFLADFGKVGGRVSISYLRDGAERRTTLELVAFYPTPRFVLIMFFVGLIMWIVAAVVAWNANGGMTASLFHWTLMASAVSLLTTYGPISADRFIPFAIRSLFVVSYPSMAVLFFSFTLFYPRPKVRPSKRTMAIVFGPLAVLVAGLWYTGTRAIMGQSAGWFTHFQTWFDLLHLSLWVYTSLAVASIIHSLRKARTPEERRQLSWIVIGVTFGVSPYLFFHILPQLIGWGYLIPEEFAVIFLLAIPFCILISLLRDRLLNVELLVSRRLLHASLTGLLTLIFVLAVLLALSIPFGSEVFSTYLIPFTVTLGLALLLNLFRRRLQRVVDDTLFAARANFHRSIGRIGRSLQQSLSRQQLLERLIGGLSESVPARVISVYHYSAKTGSLVLGSSTTDAVPSSLKLTARGAEEMAKREVHGVKGSLGASHRYREFQSLGILEGSGFALCVPIVSENHELMGALLVRPRSATDRLQEEEIDLLISVARETSEVWERLRLQEQIILDQEEKRRIEQLSALKSDFVSYVSHEFLTPLTAMGFFAELLQDRFRGGSGNVQEYLGIIRGEAARLARMVKTILNAARFESEGTVFRREPGDLVKLTREALRSMDYQLSMNHFTVRTDFPKEKLIINADAESIALAISNLIGNAIKYSPSKRHLTVRVHRKNGHAVCEVQDRGMGMPPEALARIFTKFYRAPSLEAHSKGIGLGLTLVKQVLEGHGGRVSVNSAVGAGSTFTLWFPLLERAEAQNASPAKRHAHAARTQRNPSKQRRKR